MVANPFKKKVSKVVYLQRAPHVPLGYLIECEDQRQLAQQISQGKSKVSDSPQGQRELFNFLMVYLLKNATPIDSSDDIATHSLKRVFVARNGSTIVLSTSLGWQDIETNSEGVKYLVGVLEANGYSTDTTKEAYC